MKPEYHPTFVTVDVKMLEEQIHEVVTLIDDRSLSRKAAAH